MTGDIGDLVELTATFTDPDTGEAVAPKEVVCTVLSPDGTTSTPEASYSKGIYKAEVEPDERGKWRYSFDGTGDYQASEEGVFHVRERSVPRE